MSQAGATSCTATNNDHSNDDHNTAAAACAVGKEPSDVGCFDCSLGKFKDTVGNTDCKSCVQNTYADQVAQSSCKKCDAGKTSKTGATSCTAESSVTVTDFQNWRGHGHTPL